MKVCKLIGCSRHEELARHNVHYRVQPPVCFIVADLIDDVPYNLACAEVVELLRFRMLHNKQTLRTHRSQPPAAGELWPVHTRDPYTLQSIMITRTHDDGVDEL
eukprot:2100476-Pleurochrysis_carterae.AAC.2